MKRRFVAALAALAAWPLAIAHAQPAKRKPPPPPPELPSEVFEKFAFAVIADEDGATVTALRTYRSMIAASEHAAMHYNLADLQRRMEQWMDAVASYRKYLELAPDAPDRADVERTIAQLETRPGTVVVDGEDLDAIVLVDGKLIGPSPVVLQLADGRHVVDRVSPTGFMHRSFEVAPATTQHITLTARSEERGNVILSSNLRMAGSWKDNGIQYALSRRQALPPGRHHTYLMSKKLACAPLVFDAPKADELTYVYIEVGPVPRRQDDCVSIQIRQTKLRFAP